MTDIDPGSRTEPGRVAADADSPTERDRTVAAAFAVVVFVVSVVPVPTLSSGAGGGVESVPLGALPVDVGLTAPFHFVGYAVLAALFVRATRSDRRVVAVAVAATAATTFGLAVEVVQAPIPWRSFSWADVAVNAAGTVFGAVASAMTTRLYALGRSVR